MTDDDWRALRDAIKANKRNVKYLDAKKALEAAGFAERGKTATSHRTFTKEGCFQPVTVVKSGRNNTLSLGIVRAVLQALDECGDDD